VATLDPAAPKLLVLGGESPEAIIVASRAALERLGHREAEAEAEYGALLLATVAAEKAAGAPRFALCLVCSAATLKKELELAANGVATAAASGRPYASVAGSCFSPKPTRSKQVAIAHDGCACCTHAAYSAHYACICSLRMHTPCLPCVPPLLTGGLHVRRRLEPIQWAGARPAPHRAVSARVRAARDHGHVGRKARHVEPARRAARGHGGRQQGLREAHRRHVPLGSVPRRVLHARGARAAACAADPRLRPLAGRGGGLLCLRRDQLQAERRCAGASRLLAPSLTPSCVPRAPCNPRNPAHSRSPPHPLSHTLAPRTHPYTHTDPHPPHQASLDASPVWTEALAYTDGNGAGFSALRKAWGVPEDAPVASFWAGFAVQASRAQVEAALAQLGAAADCVRLLIVNDTHTCIVAGKPAQCQALFSRLGCEAMPIEQGMAGHCKEAIPFRDEIARGAHIYVYSRTDHMHADTRIRVQVYTCSHCDIHVPPLPLQSTRCCACRAAAPPRA
jgi:hypothetical protein